MLSLKYTLIPDTAESFTCYPDSFIASYESGIREDMAHSEKEYWHFRFKRGPYFPIDRNRLEYLLTLLKSGPSKENSIGPTILKLILMKTPCLTQLNLGRVATDAILKVVALHCPHLQLLNINQSEVTEKGILALCGLGLSEEVSIRNQPTKWCVEPGTGCTKLAVLEVQGLLNIKNKYVYEQTIPMDCGLVACLTLLPLKELDFEHGSRLVNAYIKNCIGNRFPVNPLQLEILTDDFPGRGMIDEVSRICPNLKCLKVHYFESYSHYGDEEHLFPIREEWLETLPTFTSINSLITVDISFLTPKLMSVLPQMGFRLTTIDLQELWTYSYSLLRAIKMFCPYLEKFVLTTSCKEFCYGVLPSIEVFKDVDIVQDMLDNTQPTFVHLQELHLVGPFEVNLVKYLIQGSNNINSLSLGIEWKGCNVVPASSKDILGVDFLEELCVTNPLPVLTELHLFGQDYDSRKYLDKECAYYILRTFTELRHLGTFMFWNFEDLSERRAFIREVKESNRDISFDPHFTSPPSENPGKRLATWREGNQLAACSWLPFVTITSPPLVKEEFEFSTTHWYGEEIISSDEDDQ